MGHIENRQGVSLTEEMLRDQREYAKAVEKMRQEAQAARAAAPGPGRGNRRVKPKAVGAKDHETLHKAKAYLPPESRLSLETEWQLRWRVEVPLRQFPPYSRGVRFTDAPGEKREALLTALKWAWDAYTEAGVCGPCPWDFSK